MEQVSIFLKVAFVIITVITVYAFYRASNKSPRFLYLAIFWMLLQMTLGVSKFYYNDFSLPPKFLLMLLPPILLATIVATTRAGKQFMASFDLKQLTLIQTVRVALEIMLFYLYKAGTVPEIMTYYGGNFDIISGLTAPFVFYFGFIKKTLNKWVLIVWNVVALGLALNIVVTAILSTRTPFQQFGFEQPNIMVEFFPFTWLPSVVVPILLFSHFVSLRQLLLMKRQDIS